MTTSTSVTATRTEEASTGHRQAGRTADGAAEQRPVARSYAGRPAGVMAVRHMPNMAVARANLGWANTNTVEVVRGEGSAEIF
jgi:hypothetical protein